MLIELFFAVAYHHSWATIDLPMEAYKSGKDAWMLGPLDDLTAALEDSLVTMSTVLASR